MSSIKVPRLVLVSVLCKPEMIIQESSILNENFWTYQTVAFVKTWNLNEKWWE